MRAFRSILLGAVCMGCVENYFPPVSKEKSTFLVVDSNGDAAVKLSRSIPLSSNSYTPLEKGAEVTIKTSSGQAFNLIEGDSALYSASALDVNTGDEFTLHIRTEDGEEYESDQVSIYPTSPVDSVYFGVSAAGTSELNRAARQFVFDNSGSSRQQYQIVE